MVVNQDIVIHFQGISTVLETGIGAPDPEELARRSVKINETKADRPAPAPEADKRPETGSEQEASAGDAAFPFGSLLSGVTKFVETTGKDIIFVNGLRTYNDIYPLIISSLRRSGRKRLMTYQR